MMMMMIKHMFDLLEERTFLLSFAMDVRRGISIVHIGRVTE